jgi:hypothetical protein
VVAALHNNIDQRAVDCLEAGLLVVVDTFAVVVALIDFGKVVERVYSSIDYFAAAVAVVVAVVAVEHNIAAGIAGCSQDTLVFEVSVVLVGGCWFGLGKVKLGRRYLLETEPKSEMPMVATVEGYLRV